MIKKNFFKVLSNPINFKIASVRNSPVDKFFKNMSKEIWKTLIPVFDKATAVKKVYSG